MQKAVKPLMLCSSQLWVALAQALEMGNYFLKKWRGVSKYPQGTTSLQPRGEFLLHRQIEFDRQTHLIFRNSMLLLERKDWPCCEGRLQLCLVQR
jgi:hypothetical protein